MRLLFDQNISFRILKQVEHTFPGSTHVSLAGYADFADSAIFNFAKANGYCIVTFDSDYADLSIVKGFPPKIIWLRSSNQTTRNILQLFERRSQAILDFINQSESGILEISG